MALLYMLSVIKDFYVFELSQRFSQCQITSSEGIYFGIFLGL